MRAGFPPTRQGRPAFTLVELLVVVAIIAILVGLAAGVYWVTVGSSQVTTAKTLIKSVQSAANKQWDAVTDKARNDALPKGFPAGANQDATRANYIHAAQIQTFPRSFAEVLTTPPTLGVLPAYQTYFATNGLTASISTCNPPIPNANHAALESSICLVMALERAQGGSAITADDLKASIKEFTINGGNKPVKALVDPWGQPLWFVYQQTTVNGQNQYTPYLISAGPNMSFSATYSTQTLPVASGDDLGSK